MTTGGSKEQARRVPLWQVHPSYRPAMAGVALLLGLLALVQGLAWAIPVPPGATGLANYLALHELMETVSIVIALMVFAVGWNSHGGKSSGNLMLLACIFFAVGWLDFFHTASYGGMPEVVSPNDADKHLYAWIAARFLAAASLLLVALRPWDSSISNSAKYGLFGLLCGATALLVWAVIWHQDSLPKLFVPGQGLTRLKKGLEYGFVATNLVTAGLLWRKLREPQPFNVPLLFAAVETVPMPAFVPPPPVKVNVGKFV